MAKGKIAQKNKHSKPNNLVKTRKQLRKEQRKQKKARRNEYYTNRGKSGETDKFDDVETVGKHNEHGVKQSKEPNNKSSHGIKNKQLSQNQPTLVENARAKEKNDQAKLQKEMNKQRNKQLLDANLEEDRNIKRLEKQLKLHKRKSKAVPKSFALDGLDYLLEVCDSEGMKGATIADQQLNEVNDEFEEDFALMAGDSNNTDISGDESDSNQAESVKNAKKRNIIDSGDQVNKKVKIADQFEDSEDCDLNIDNESLDSEFDVDEEDEESDDDNFDEIGDSEHDQNEMDRDDDEDDEELDIESDNKTKSDEKETKNSLKKNSDGTWEDIYGRLRDEDGNIVTDKSQDKYIPPAIRAKMANSLEDKARIQKLDRLKRQLKGLINRLAESNMHNIATQIEQLYMNNSRHDMNNTLTSLINEALVSNVLTPERLLMEHVLLIATLHANVGTEVGAHFLQTMVKQFDEQLNGATNIENKQLDNVINIIAQLYNFKLFDSKLIYEILAKLSTTFQEKNVECILHILKSVGFSLRKDNPLELKNLILNLQKQAADVPHEFKNNARLKFMLEILLAIKNNNVSKIPNYDTTYSEHLKKIMKGFIRKGNYITQLNISLEDLLKADERGRWWVVGSAWSGNTIEKSADNVNKETTSFSQNLLDLARKQRMNTDTRRNIFCIIMSSEDYLDAFEKLLRLGLKNQQEREIVHVILHCCLQEKKYNPFYAILTQKFCEHDRKYQMTIKYSIWDKLKALKEHSGSQISNLAKLLSYLFVEKGLPISVLKVVQFSELDKVTLRFMRQILLGILLLEDEEASREVFERVAQSDKLKMFRESLRLFIHHFLLRNLNQQDIHRDKKELLQRRAKVVERTLAGREKFKEMNLYD